MQAIKDKKLHMIGNAHIDPVWLWQWQEGFHEVKATFRSALDRMNEYPDFVFISSSAAFYDWLEQSDPGMFAEIRKRVSEGRWGIVGGWWIQPDCNIPSGESFVRQGLYGQRYFKEKFGVTAKVGYNVDSFGHNGMLPQILKKSGMAYYVFMRPSPHEKGLPGRLFWWEADDGSRVLAFRIPYEYCSWGKDLETHVQRCAAEIKDPASQMMCFYGVGNHGGGPTRENLESILRLNEEESLPELVFSSPEQFFADVASQNLAFPVVHDDLQHHASGCYAAHSAIKRWNRQAEHLLTTAEKLASAAHQVTGQAYPKNFDRAWKNVLFNQFHDILAGTSLEEAYEDARNLHGEAMSIAGRGLNLAVQALAWKVRIEPEEGMQPIQVFNPHTWDVRANVELEMGGSADALTILDDAGKNVPVQKIASRAIANGRYRISFSADLPSLGYRTYRLYKHAALPNGSGVTASDTVLENERFRLEIDPQSGAIRSLRDKLRNLEVFCGEAAKAVVVDDPSDTWSHNVFSFQNAVGAFEARRVRLVEHGPVKSVIRVESEYERSTLMQEFCMLPGADRIDVRVTVDWREGQKALKLRFPVNLTFMKATSEIPYGHIERFANGQEEPGGSWLDLSGVSRDTGQTYGVSLLNDGKYSYDVNVRDIGLTVLRSPIYVHHIPAVPDPDKAHTYMDQGVQTFNYAILPHDGSWETAGTVKQAAELNQKPILLNGTYHPDGVLPQSDSYLSIDAGNVIVSVVKQAEDGDDLIVRAVETNKTATKAVIRLNAWDRTIEAEFGPCEIKTFRVPKDASAPVVETDLLEGIE